ncbi:hypothetical protein HPB50_006014 [Hyalomma asiaticum]|uniref:Uncharacterized protein n=1 Tax=Hyalomma asiaticum TaxID=266040 RepID=A0ACB7SLJ7_HYAAI|nr:hypothetical protein HPB50_006014 [Hyalomma asiaticum]
MRLAPRSTWVCPSAGHTITHSTNPTFRFTTAEQWEAMLHSACPEDQQWAVRLTRGGAGLTSDAASIQGLATA